ncbi:MAG TPA: hypothetical protein VJG66_00810 [Patescibacteria group bacterium]|nr:hypothetical protein [Patescibacteria group bacterium]
MQPKIIVSPNKKERDEELRRILQQSQITSNNPDLFVLDEEKIGIAQIKQLIKHLSTKPFGKTAKSAVIFEGSNISPDAQNALLKILEEPPEESVILIGADSETRLLPTILSRCKIINLASHLSGGSVNFDLDELINKSIGERFEIVEKASDKEKLLNDLVESYRERVFKGEEPGEFLGELLQAQIWKESNVNIRTILEYLMLKLDYI